MSSINQDILDALQKVPQYTRFKRHALSIFKHSTPKKLFNLAVIELERKRHCVQVKGLPYYYIIDSGNICNLRCPLCPTGTREIDRDRKLLGYDQFAKIIDKISPYAYEVSLHNWGEPFLNKDIFKMIRYCRRKNISNNLSSNLNVRNIDAEELVLSGLEYLVVSLDGLSQDVYSTYRVGGNIETVFNNLKKIIRTRKKLKKKYPLIEWQYIVMKHNCHQLEEAKKMAEAIGVDLIRFIPVGFPIDAPDKPELAQRWFPDFAGNSQKEALTGRFLQKPIPGGCFYLYRSMTIHPDGHVAPCCVVYKKKDDFDTIFDKPLEAIWNNQKYQSARSLFSENKKSMITTACDRCTLFTKKW